MGNGGVRLITLSMEVSLLGWGNLKQVTVDTTVRERSGGRGLFSMYKA